MPFILNGCRKGGTLILCLFMIFFSTSFVYRPQSVIDNQSKWREYKNEILKLRVKLQRRSDNLKARRSDWQHIPRLYLKLHETDQRIASLTHTLGVLDTLERSTQKYSLSDTSIQGFTGEGVTRYRTVDSVIEFVVGDIYNFIHETTHGGQFERHDLFYIIHAGSSYASPFGDDVFDEIEAYKAEYAYDPRTVRRLDRRRSLRSMDSITVNWLLDLRDGNGRTIYKPEDSPHVVSEKIDLNSDSSEVKSAYYFLKNIQKWPYKTVKDDPNIIFKHP